MYELIRKDVGLCRNVFFGCLIALFAPYVATVSNTLGMQGLTREETIEHFGLGLLWAAVLSIYFSILAIGFLAGFIIAGERRDRSAEFLAFLPPTKWMVISSKAIVCFGWIAIVAIVYLLFTELIVPWISDGENVYRQSQGNWLLLSAAGLCVFGVAWLFSCCIESPVFSVLAGLIAPFVIFIAITVVDTYWPGLEMFEGIFGWFLIVILVIGVTSFIGGVWHFISRVEP